MFVKPFSHSDQPDEHTRRARREIAILELVQLQLNRAQDRSLSVSLPQEMDNAAVQLLNLHHRRWREAAIYFTMWTLANFLSRYESSRCSFDQLRSLYVCFRHGGVGETLPSHSQVFMRAPELRSLNLDEMRLSTLDFPWSQLTELSLQWVSATIGEFRQVLARCVALERLTILSSFDQAFNDRSIPSPIPLPKLHTLRLTPSSYDILLHLCLPSLKHIVQGGFVSSLLPVQTCAQRSSFTLQSLALNYRDDIFDQILKEFPDLTHLDVAYPTSRKDEALRKLLAVLSYGEESKAFPKLWSLVLRSDSPRSTPNLAEGFIRMVTSRSGLAVGGVKEDLGESDDGKVVALREMTLVLQGSGAELADALSQAQMAELKRVTTKMRFEVLGNRTRGWSEALTAGAA